MARLTKTLLTVAINGVMPISSALSDFRSPSAEAVSSTPCGDREEGVWATPSSLPGPAPAHPAATRCLHSLTIPDGPAAIRSCSAPPLAASLRLALESLTRSAGWDVASTPALQHQCLVLNHHRCIACRVAIHGDQVTQSLQSAKFQIRYGNDRRWCWALSAAPSAE